MYGGNTAWLIHTAERHSELELSSEESEERKDMELSEIETRAEGRTACDSMMEMSKPGESGAWNCVCGCWAGAAQGCR